MDDKYIPYDDQWAYLSQIAPISPEEVDDLLRLHSKGDALDPLVPQEEEAPKPWQRQVQSKLPQMELRDPLQIVRSNLLYIPDSSLTPRTKNRLLRLAAFKNPDFYKTQSMRLPIYNKPRVICTAEERDGYLALPKKRGRKKQRPLIGQLGGNKNTLSGLIDIAIIPSLIHGAEVKDIIKDYGMVIVDECHHVSALSFERVLKKVPTRYVYGLTATPNRQDGHQPIIYMQCGPIRYRIDAREQAEKRNFEHYIIPRSTTFHASDPDKTITDYYRDLVNHEPRNEWIIQDVRQALAQGRTPLVLTERREHVHLLAQMLSSCCKNIVLLFGTASAKDRRETLEQLRAIPDTEPLLIIATGKYVGEGFDYPRLDTLFLTLPISWKGKVAQYAGRLHRNYPGKKEVQVYDYVDLHVPMLETMYQRRLKGYAAIGYKLKSDSSNDAAPDLIYDDKSFFPVYCQDLGNAMQSVWILSPFLKKTRVREIAKCLAEPLSKGATVTVLTRPPEDFPKKNRVAVTESADLLREMGVHVCYRSAFHQKFTIIDNRTVWYGSINFLSFGASEEGIMRFTNRDIALQLEESISPTPESR